MITTRPPLPLAGQASRAIPVLAPNTFTEELQLQGTAADKAINYSLGGYLDRQTWSGPAGIEEFTLFPVGTLIPPVPFFQELTSHSEAVFGQATVDLGLLAPALSGLSVTGGLRYTWEHSFTSTTLIAPPATTGTFDDQYLSYTATIDYDVTDGVHVYVTSRDAYKSGGVNGPVPAGSAFRTFPAEKLSDIEAGLKAQFDLGSMKGRFNLAAYRGNYDNIQRTTAEEVGGVVLNVTRSAAKGRVQGVEVNAALMPVTGLTLNGSYSYIDARYTRVADASAGVILNGAPFPYTPRHKYSLGAAYEAPLGRAGDLVVNANYVRQTSVSTAQTNQAFYRELPGYGLLNANVGLNNIGGRPLSITVFATNLTDVARPVGVIDLYAGGAGVVGLTYTEPRMYGVRVGYRFGQ
ncbi:TonB-dependent receptor domain-containing protein [Sphingomonas adhaesiva]|uniref:TonB-dependent receptor domain-containing protein n=1 Tax=Sphingomonas adhaesiva TaxID=28212 RepID=UPI002FF90A02